MHQKKTLKLASLSAIIFLFSACQSTAEKDTYTAGKNKSEQIAFLPEKQLNSASLPAGISYEGRFRKALRWQDAAGENLLLLTETPPHPTKVVTPEIDYSSDAPLYAYHYLLEGSTPRLTWKVYDFVENCPVDIVAEFVLPECTTTDFNKNGTAEIWLLYKTVCHGDVSPMTMKLICYEGGQKFAMRGENKVQSGTHDDGSLQ